MDSFSVGGTGKSSGGGMLNLAFQGQRRWEGSARGLEGIERVALEERVRDSEIS